MRVGEAKVIGTDHEKYAPVAFMKHNLMQAAQIFGPDVVVSAAGSWMGDFLSNETDAVAEDLLAKFVEGVKLSRAGHLAMQAKEARDANQVC